MDEKIYTLVSTGLLAVMVLLLIAVIGRLARLERALRGPDVTAAEDAAETTSTEKTAEETAEGTELEPTEASTDFGEEGPFERDGRWWFKRDDELLVFNEQTQSWVMPDSELTAPAVEEPEMHPLDEARGWNTSSEDVTAAPIPEPVSAPASITPTEVEPAPETPTQESPESVPATSATNEIEQDQIESAASEDSASGAHWKCPSCGVINGSTATSCRMCFTARP